MVRASDLFLKECLAIVRSYPLYKIDKAIDVIADICIKNNIEYRVPGMLHACGPCDGSSIEHLNEDKLFSKLFNDYNKKNSPTEVTCPYCGDRHMYLHGYFDGRRTMDACPKKECQRMSTAYYCDCGKESVGPEHETGTCCATCNCGAMGD